MLGESDFLLKLDDIKPLPEKEKIYTQKSGIWFLIIILYLKAKQAKD